MALLGAAVCPHPPLLVPEVGVGVEPAARSASLTAVAGLVAADPEVVVVVGADNRAHSYDATAIGGFAGYGVDLVVPLGPPEAGAGPAGPDGRVRLPLSLTVGAWLLHTVGYTGPRRALGVPDTTTPAEAAALGAELANSADRVVLLCMGDGSARRTEKAPGWLDPRAEPFDADLALALGTADRRALLALDPELARALLVAGRASFQVLAGAAGAGAWTGELLCDEVPFGVGYLVARWSPAS